MALLIFDMGVQRVVILFLSCQVSISQSLLITTQTAPHSKRLPSTILTQTAIPSIQEDKTALDYFDDMHDDRIEQADRVPFDLSVFELGSSNKRVHLENAGQENRPYTGISSKYDWLPPIIDFEYLSVLYGSFGQSGSADNAAERHRFFQLIQSRGGCCLVKFRADSEYASVLKKMWLAMDEFYQLVDTEITGTWKEKSRQVSYSEAVPEGPVLMRQHLTKPEQSPDAGGYDFVQTYWDPESKRVVPTTIQDTLGWDHPFASSIEDSFHALSEVSKLFTIVLSSGGLHKPIQKVESLLNDAVLNDFGCCNHRLCQYRPPDSTMDRVEPLLRSHTDWSLVTCIPVSPTPGLLTFDPLHQQWLAPDTVTKLVSGETSADQCHYQYCLMMTGKSMDMLIGVQGGMACIHQVVPTAFQKERQTNSAPPTQHQRAPKHRLSAPFFLRPKEAVSVRINEECNKEPCPSRQQSIAKLHQVYCELAT